MLKAIVIRIYPDKEQADYIGRLVGCCRFVYNQCLEYRSKQYKENGISVSAVEAVKHLTDLKDDYPFLRDVHSKVLQQSVRDMNTAYDNFFRHGYGFPRYKSKHGSKQSCRFPKDAFMGVRGNRIDLTRALRDIHFKCSRRDEKFLNGNQDAVHSLTLTMTHIGKYYLSVLVECPEPNKDPVDGVVGIDLGVKDFYVDSNGNRLPNPHFYRNAEKRLKHLNRVLSRRTKGSHSWWKAVRAVARLNEKIADRRGNFIRQAVSRLVGENQVICVEDLNVKGMLKNRKLSKCIQDVSFGEFLNTLSQKCDMHGRILVRIGRFYPSSKRCCHCGYIYRNLTLSEREWDCPQCGSHIDRDYNAARNILDEGLRIIGLSSPESKPGENPPVDDRHRCDLRSSGSLKQEKACFPRISMENGTIVTRVILTIEG